MVMPYSLFPAIGAIVLSAIWFCTGDTIEGCIFTAAALIIAAMPQCQSRYPVE